MNPTKRLSALIIVSALTLGLFAPPLEQVALASKAGTQESSPTKETEYVSVAPSNLPGSAELEAMYIEQLFYGEGISTYKDYGYNLTGATRQIYDQLRTEIEAIANGTKTKTSGISVTWDTPFESDDELTKGIESAVDHLMVDLPADFYWYDKTTGYRYSYTSTLSSATLKFAVSENYKDPDVAPETIGEKVYYLSVDSTKINSAKTAVSNAQQIASKYEAMTEYDKIKAFCQEICDLTSYNNEAADKKDTPYGDPWQLVWVFDGDPSTNVVCEGYSKAFQYLCDLSGIDCYTVTGTMAGGTGAGGHMWNIVVLDGISYLVDITNCDEGTIGNPDRLLLKGASESSETGCTFNNLSSALTYTYDTDLIYTKDILKVSTTDCPEPAPCEHEYGSQYDSDGENHWKVCTKCGAADVNSKEAHTFGDDWISDEKTHHHACTVCLFVKDSAAHTETTADNAVASTCTQKGKEADTICSVCSYLIKEGEETPLAAHTPGEAVRENEVAATCTVVGSYDEVIKCTVCNETISTTPKTIPAKGHNPGTEWTGDETSHWKECQDCGLKFNETAHTENSGTVTTRPTETAEGVRTYSCTVCGRELRTETIPMLEEGHKHAYTIQNSDETHHWKECVCGESDDTSKSEHTLATREEIITEATCGKEGSKDVITYCSDCNREIGRSTEAIPKTEAHTESADFSKDASNHWKTCTVCGEALRTESHTAGPAATETSAQTCTICGYEIAPMLTHTHTFDTAWSKDDSYHWHKATCSHTEEVSGKAAHTWDGGAITTQPTETAKGVKTYTCTVCKAVKTEAVKELASTPKPMPTPTPNPTPNPTPTPTPTPQPSEVAKEVEKGENAPDTSLATSEKDLADMILTEEEKAQVANGTEIKIVLDVRNVTSTISNGEKEAVKKVLNGYKAGQYLDLNLYKLIGESRSGISETAKKIRITIEIPNGLKDSTKERTFAVVRVHNGQGEFLEDLDNNADTITIETDRFSTYAITYKDKEPGEGSGSGSQEKTNTTNTKVVKSPQTGDPATAVGYIVLSMIAGAACILLYFRRESGK
ncbi:MAG: hypothetical protein HFJ10_07010 [Lachnospiraceae bacterium]|nr:hypothetical protein [Lachnospiraceae bacterium]